MSVESESERRIYEKLQSMEERIDDLKSGYLLINQRYSETLSVLKRLTSSTLEAATRAAVSAEKSADACHNAMDAAIAAANAPLVAASIAAAESAARSTAGEARASLSGSLESHDASQPRGGSCRYHGQPSGCRNKQPAPGGGQETFLSHPR